jgi:signal transduction histidine kinase/CheY-like chemotaxis protein
MSSVKFSRDPWFDRRHVDRRSSSANQNSQAQRVHHVHGEAMAIFATELTTQKMRAVGTMAGGIAHDFNNIIEAILGNVELARLEVLENSEAAVSLVEIDKAGRRARDLVRQLLVFSSDELTQRTPLQLNDVMPAIMQRITLSLPPHVTLQLHMNAETPTVMADAAQIEQALIQLCNNAIHAIGSQAGNICIELGTDMGWAQAVTAPRGATPGQHVKLRVSDTGCGMSEETLARAFDPFFTTKPVGQGRGLGLSVVHGIMRSHQAWIQAESIPGVGSSFTLHFPPLEGVPVASGAVPARPPVQATGQRVMYVDDDEALAFLVKRVLTRNGFTVATFTDPRQAIAVLRANPAAFDLLVTDYNMPEYNGLELVRDAQNIRPDLPLALASGYMTPEIEHAALLAGASALIHKANDVNELCCTVQQLLGNGTHATASMRT